MAYIKGIFIQDIFHNSDNGYIVGLLRIKETDIDNYIGKVVTFTGIFDELKFKATYKMQGEFTNHKTYGEQFNVSNYELILPTEEDELVDFFSSDLFPIGESLAKKIVDKLGKDAIKIILADANSLIGIKRLSSDKALRIFNILNELSSSSQVIIDLNKMGFSTKQASDLFKKYGVNVLKIIDNDIYSVISDELSFNEIDKIARNNGYTLNDERRLLALVINMFKIITFNTGDTYLYLDDMLDFIKKNTDDLDKETLIYILMKLNKMDKIVIDGDRYYLREFYEAEGFIARRLIALNEVKKSKKKKLDEMINALELVNNITYDDTQREAIKKALSNNLTIITGGPGTGKTTIVKGITKLLTEYMEVKPNKIALLAPTGRAARKLMMTTNIPAYTIHKYLGWDKDKDVFTHDIYNPNLEEYIIIDEASMIDTMLCYNLFQGILASAKVILIGDYYQLPSVGQGQILKDIIDSERFEVVRLMQLYRQSEDSYINTLANKIKLMEIDEEMFYKYDDYNFIETPSESVNMGIKKVVLKAIDKGYDDKDIQVLAPIYRGNCGINSLNKMLQEIMNPKNGKKNEIVSGEVIYREGDKILQLVNDPDNGVSNGDIGYITSIVPSSQTRSKKNEITINYDGVMVTYTPKDFINFMHGYAISVHKSQGGEYPMVIMPIVPAFKGMLYNKLIYTAVTRAKKSLILLGSMDAFIYGIKNDYIDKRKTTLKELLEIKYN